MASRRGSEFHVGKAGAVPGGDLATIEAIRVVRNRALPRTVSSSVHRRV
jgi:hypothetical protein